MSYFDEGMEKDLKFKGWESYFTKVWVGKDVAKYQVRRVAC